MKNKIYIGIGIALVAVIVVFFLNGGKANEYSALKTYQGSVDYYKDITCGCCDLHSNYLRNSGGLKLNIKTESPSDIKDQMEIPAFMRSCHTAVIGGYFVEGHVPLEAINKLMEEQPNIKGIGLPAMPEGSPGMPGQKRGEWKIYALNHDGSTSEFMII